MRKKKRKKILSHRIRILCFLVVFCSITLTLGYNFLNTISKISKMKDEKKNLQAQLVSIQGEKETLESDVSRLEDEDYIAKYVREKYFYSKEGELILRLD